MVEDSAVSYNFVYSDERCDYRPCYATVFVSLVLNSTRSEHLSHLNLSHPVDYTVSTVASSSTADSACTRSSRPHNGVTLHSPRCCGAGSGDLLSSAITGDCRHRRPVRLLCSSWMCLGATTRRCEPMAKIPHSGIS
jgi:hypothetical protein